MRSHGCNFGTNPEDGLTIPWPSSELLKIRISNRIPEKIQTVNLCTSNLPTNAQHSIGSMIET